MDKTTPFVLNPGTAIIPNMKGYQETPERRWPADVQNVPIPMFDTGVFINELINANLLLKVLKDKPELLLEKVRQGEYDPECLKEGTLRGTRLALSKIYDLIEKNYSSYMDTANIEPTVPSRLSPDQKKMYFVFTDPDSDKYPPHLNLYANKPFNRDVPEGQGSELEISGIFNKARLLQLSSMIEAVIPDHFLDRVIATVTQGVASPVSWAVFGSTGRPDAGTTLAEVEKYNKEQLAKAFRNDIFDLPNIGNLPDWYSDKRFAQQFFTGTNPTTIKQAGEWTKIFIDAATDPKDRLMKDKISQRAAKSPESLYVQDYSYFRKATGTDDFRSAIKNRDNEGGEKNDRKSYRYAVSSVCLFNLADGGALEPLAIIIDWRGSAENSVFIYNRELHTDEQKGDWAWRYAKTCVMSSDWMQHEITVHLCRTHLVEEAIIVAANRTLPQEHDVFQLLYPHWLKTLSVNAAARDTLVPKVIVPIMGIEEKHILQFLRYEYDNFDFQGSYIPEDLERRGFPTEKLDQPKYHNYAWARCIHSMWKKIRSYVKDMLLAGYENESGGRDQKVLDQKVRDDEHLQNWSREMREGAKLKSFPELKTFDALVDAVTMCIHIASPQHTSVNYLQNFYQAFVVNKPPALYRPPPRSREELLRYTEADLVNALPMNHPKDWLLASHIPYLLSFKPGDKESLIMYAASKYHVYKFKRDEKSQKIKAAAALFYEQLYKSKDEFHGFAKATDDHEDITYDVLNPDWNAVSILI